MHVQACGRDDDACEQEARYLNQLLERAHIFIYMGRSGSSGINVVRFYRETYPQIFRETLPYTMMAFIVFLAAEVAGTLLGVGTTACWQAGMALPLLSFVAPHGVLELPAIFIAGGAGLVIARGLLFPGVLPRRDSLTRAGRRPCGCSSEPFRCWSLRASLKAFSCPRTCLPTEGFSLPRPWAGCLRFC